MKESESEQPGQAEEDFGELSKIEQAYFDGQRVAAISLFALALGMIGRENLTQEQKNEYQRIKIIHKLRQICGEYGDNNWNDNLAIEDILSNHLEPYLYDLKYGQEEEEEE